MRKRIGTCLLAALMLAALMVPALAAEPTGTEPGIYDLKPTNCTVQVKDDKGTVLEAQDGFYAKAVKLTVQVQVTDDANYYLILALSGEDKNPTKDNIVYIDQKGEGTFDVYPSTMKGGETYKIYLSSDKTAQTEVVSFKYYEPKTEPDYKLGDVNADGKTNTRDATLALMIYAKMIQTEEQAANEKIKAEGWKARANVDGNKNSDGSEKVNTRDATIILEIYAKMRDPVTGELIGE